MISAVELEPSIAARVKESGAHFVVTGATGWFGKALLDALTHALGEESKERLHAFASRENAVELMDGTTVPVRPLQEINALPQQHRYFVFHLAFLTKDKQSAMPLEEYAERNRAIRTQVGEALGRLNVSGLCVTSSGAVYTKERTLNRDLEAYPYAALKVEEEEYFTRLCAGRIPLIIPRIFNMSGPYINKWDAYALSSLLQMAMRGEPLIIKARHPVIRSYVYVGDIINVVTGWLLQTQPETLIFDVSSSETIEIGELAERICQLTGRDSSAIIRDYNPSLPADRYRGEGEVFGEMCRRAFLSSEAQMNLTYQYMRPLIGILSVEPS
ncbi:MAG TPA: NAD(P)-dependent oxidoreductase [Rickettsiales bacterium]|nr:NAD(P)-dependent oxidoreductase [Rickettsiales bacterium]